MNGADQTSQIRHGGQDYAAIAPLDVIGLLRVVWQGKLIIICTVFAMTLTGGYYAFQIAQPKFAATATLQMNPQAANLRDVSNHWPSPATDSASLNTQVTILTSDSILTTVIAQLDLRADPEFNRYLNPASPLSISAMRGRLRQFLSGTIDLTPDDDAIAQKTVENLRSALSAVQPRDTHIFRITAHSRDPDKAALLANTAAAAYIAHQIATKEEAANADIGWLSARVSTLRDQLEQQERAVTHQIAQAQLQEETMLDTLSSAVLSIDEERSATMAELARYDGAAASVRQTAEIAQLRNQLHEIDARRTRLRDQLVTQSEGLVTLQQMQREADATRVLYQSFLARLQETQVQRGLDFPDSRMIAPAATGHYIGPRKMLLIEVSAILGGLLGLALVAAQHLSRTGIYHPDHLLAATGLPVFAVLPASVTRNRKSLLRYLDSAAGGVCLRNLASGLILSGYGQLPQVVAVTAAQDGEAQAGLAITIARGLARKGRTLIIDTAPVATRLLLGGVSPVHDAPLGVDVLRLADADNLLEADFLAKFKTDYAHIVVIAAPVVGNPGTQLLARHADATILAVRWAKTPKAVVRKALSLCENATDGPIGLALTQTRARKMKQLGKIIAPQVSLPSGSA